MRPNGLDSLSMRHPYTIHVRKVEGRLTRRSMADDMKLWNCDTE